MPLEPRTPTPLTSTRRFTLALLTSLAVNLAAGCPPPEPECGNGVVEDGESESTCCEDTGCGYGICGAASACEDPWTSTCESDGEGACIGAGPNRCEAGAALPSSDCTACGCGGGDRCEDQVCVDVDTRDSERDLSGPPNDLELVDFFALIEDANTLEGTLGEVISAHREIARLDRRAATVIIGRMGDATATRSDESVDESTGLEAAIAARVAERIAPRPTSVIAESGRLPVGYDSGDAILGDPLSSDLSEACTTVQAAAVGRASDENNLVVFADAARAHRESCFSPELFFLCTHPHLDGCAERSGARPLTLMVMSTALILDRLERQLLVRIGNQQAGSIDSRLEQTITRWLDLVSSFIRPARYRVDLDANAVAYVRTRPARARDAAVVLVIEDRAPWGLQAFRVLWNDAPAQSFFTNQDVTAADCAYVRVADAVTFDCVDDGAEVHAVIDLTTQTLVTLDLTPRP